MLTPGKVIPFYPRYDGRQPALRVVCCRWRTLSTKSPSKPACLISEVAHG
jgi:hypothetical protein